WAKNDRLLIWVVIRKDQRGVPYGINFYGVIFPVPIRRVISIGFDGGGGVVLFGDNKRVLRRAFNTATVVDFMQDDPRQVLMHAWDVSNGVAVLYAVDVYTGHATVVERGTRNTGRWFSQRGVPMLRIDSNLRNTVMSIYGRAPGETDWKLVRKARR